MKDMQPKGRAAKGCKHGTHTKPEKVCKGESHGMAKLTEEDVKEIRRRYKSHHKINGLAALSREFGLNCTTAARIVHRHLWKHI